MSSKALLLKLVLGRPFQIKAPAKLNLRLKIIGQRADGYHYLSMLNLATEPVDVLKVKFCKSSECCIEVSDSSTRSLSILSEDNLITRAVRVFCDEFNVSFGLRVQLEKNIPIGAGLGGGSSDAGAILRLLQGLLEQHCVSIFGINREKFYAKVHKCAALVSADVPYCLGGGFSYVTGTGERVISLSSACLEDTDILLFLPPFPSLSKELYARYDLKHPKPIGEGKDLEFESRFDTLKSDDFEFESKKSALAGLIENDFEEVFFDSQPELHSVFLELRKISTIIVSLSGSGSAFFAVNRSLGRIEEEVCRMAGALARGSGIKMIKTSLIHALTLNVT